MVRLDARDPLEAFYQRRRYIRLRRSRIPARFWWLFPFAGRRLSLRERVRRVIGGWRDATFRRKWRNTTKSRS